MTTSVIPAARGLFQKVIAQSGSPVPIAHAQARAAAEALAQTIGVEPSAEALRNTPLAAFDSNYAAWQARAARQGYALRPCQDGDLIPDSPLALVDQGVTRAIEIAIGSNRDEMGLFAALEPSTARMDHAAAVQRVTEMVGSSAEAEKLVAAYEDARRAQGLGTEPWQLHGAIMGDYFIRMDSLQFLERHVACGGTGYSYLVDWESPMQYAGSCHGIELPFCFGTLETAPGMDQFAGSGPDARAFRDRMLHAWADFAHGDAKSSFGAAFDPVERNTMRFGLETGRISAPQEAERTSWEQLL